jgi:transcription initiation factor TFIIIB Brf1 subunit/transcription initiation factor TFIIB
VKDRPDFSTMGADAILAHLPEVDAEGLDHLLRNPAFTERHALALLKRPSLGGEVLARISQERALTKRYQVRVALANHPNTPRVLALELVHQLFWRDLLRVAENLRLQPQVRRAAEEILAETAEVLTLGEKIALARAATRGIILVLRKEKEPRVVEALLQNSRLVEEDILFMASRPTAPAHILQQIGANGKWSTRYPVRLALARHPNTPPGVALSFLTSFTERDLRVLVNRPGVPRLVRDGARNVLSALAARR